MKLTTFALLMLLPLTAISNHEESHDTPGNVEEPSWGLYGPGNSVGAQDGDPNCIGDFNSFVAKVNRGRGDFASDQQGDMSGNVDGRFGLAVLAGMGFWDGDCANIFP
jgi:hypothetical protein